MSCSPPVIRAAVGGLRTLAHRWEPRGVRARRGPMRCGWSRWTHTEAQPR